MARLTLSLPYSPPPESGKGISDTGEESLIPGVSVITEGKIATHFAKFGDEKVQMAADEETLRTIVQGAASYANGVKVKAGHEGGIKDVIGRLTNFSIKVVDGIKRVVADLHLSKTARDYASLYYAVTTIPDTIGLSINADGPVVRIGDLAFPRFDTLFSTDLVTEPSANPSGLFEIKVDTPKKDQGAANMPFTPEDHAAIAAACMTAMKPSMDAMTAKLSTYEAELSKKADKTKEGPGNDGDAEDEAQYEKIKTKLEKHIGERISLSLQDTAKTLHALGLTTGLGPASSIEKGGTPGKKPEDMEFDELLQHAFSLPENKDRLKAVGGKAAIVREIVLANPAKHRVALAKRDLSGNFVGIRIPKVA